MASCQLGLVKLILVSKYNFYPINVKNGICKQISFNSAGRLSIIDVLLLT